MTQPIIKLAHKENMTNSPNQAKTAYNYINVIRSDYSDDLLAFFIKNRGGALLLVNSNLSIAEQAKAVKLVKTHIDKCKITNMGMLKKDWSYVCGGICCK